MGKRADRKRRKARKLAFLGAFAKCGIIGQAGEESNVPRATIAMWRRNDPKFSIAYDLAIEEAADSLEAVANRRARGYEEPIIYKDTVVWARYPNGDLKLGNDLEPIALTRVSHSDHILLAMLKAKKAEYREKSSMELSGPNGGPLPTSVTIEFVESDGAGGMKNADTESDSQD